MTHTHDTLMALADTWAKGYSLHSKEGDEARAALSAALQEVLAERDAEAALAEMRKEQVRYLMAERDANAKDAARIDWLESSKEAHGFCHTGNGEYRHYAFQANGFANVRDTIDAAMKGTPT